jgi:hypothetical protein
MTAGHRFKVGDRVRVAARLSRTAVEAFLDVVTSIDVQQRGEVWEVVRLRPPDESGFQYHIKAESGLERVVHEKELAAAE